MHQNLKDNILNSIWKTTKTKVSIEKRQSGLPADKKLFTPGPLGCSLSTKEAMLRDLGSRDSEFIRVIFCLDRTHHHHPMKMPNFFFADGC